jgi:hypothetical protein
VTIAVTFFELFGISNWGFAAAAWVRTSEGRWIGVQFAALSRPITLWPHAHVLVSILHYYRQCAGEQ